MVHSVENPLLTCGVRVGISQDRDSEISESQVRRLTLRDIGVQDKFLLCSKSNFWIQFEMRWYNDVFL